MRKRMSYRLDFWVTTVLVFVSSILIPWFFWGAIYAQADGEEINGYSLKEMLLYICVAILVGRLVRGAEHVADVADDIYQGTLNRYLLYPANYLSMKYPQHLGGLLPNILQMFIFLPLAILVVGDQASISFPSLLLAIPLLLLANLLFYLMVFPLQAVAFWADNVWSLMIMLRMASILLGGAMVPLALFPEAARDILRFLPFACFYDLPVRCLLGEVHGVDWIFALLLGSAWCIVLHIIGQVVWLKGEHSYSGVGI
jgi:ABC-2 type transport system permease protein